LPVGIAFLLYTKRYEYVYVPCGFKQFAIVLVCISVKKGPIVCKEGAFEGILSVIGGAFGGGAVY
jgi:hypothetical protein